MTGQLSPTTAFSRLGPHAARGLLVVTLMVALGGAAWSPAPQGVVDESARPHERLRGRAGDLALHQATRARTARGENYYDAVGVELQARGYPTGSVFNWRTPFPVLVLARIPPAWGRAILFTIGIAVVVLGYLWLSVESGRTTAAWGALLLLGGVLPCPVNGLTVMSELWAGALIALSVVCYGHRWPAAGKVTALLALFCRELAAPYWVVCIGLAIRYRQWREAVGLALGLFAYAAFYTWHLREVLPRIQPGAPTHAGSWIALGGLPFVLATVQMNGFLFFLPIATAAVYPVAAALGFASWTSLAGQRAGLTAGAYVAAFAVVGQPFNQYWGSVTAPLLCLRVARCPLALRALWQRATF